MNENSQDPQLSNQLIMELTESIKGLNATVGINTAVRNASLTAEEKERLKNNGLLSENSQDLGQNSQSLQELNRVQKVAAETNKKVKERLDNFSEALVKSTDSVSKLFNQLVSQDPTRSFKKYGDGIDELGKSFSKVVSHAGILGKTLGLVAEGFGTVFKLQAEQAENLHKANDQLAKFGTAGNFTINELRDMANAAGVTSRNMEVLVKPLTSLGPALINLGGTTGQGAKAFADLVKITNKQREEYQRLGVSQQDLAQNQADYIQLQRLSGRTISTEVKDRAALQKASLEYTDNLLQLSAISGEDVETLKKRQQEASTVAELQIKNMQMEQRAADLRKKGDEASLKEADRIQKEMVVRQKLLDMAVSTQDKQTIAGVQAYLATGTITEASKHFAIMGLDMDKYGKAMKEGRDISGDFANDLTRAGKNLVNTVGSAAVFSDEIRKTTGLNKEFMAFLNKGVADYNKTTADAKTAQEAAKSKGKDPAQDARAALTTLEIKAGVAMDQLTGKMNILTGGFTTTTVLLTAFGAALTGVTGLLIANKAKSLKDAGLKALENVPRGLPGTGGIVRGGTTAATTAARTATTAGNVAENVSPLRAARLERVAAGRAAQAAAAGAPTVAPPVPARAPGGGADIGKTLASAGKGLGELGTGAGKAIAGIGQGGGKAIAALFKGVASGLQAFANPLVIAGAAGFGAAIAAVGAGLAAATWLMGKALPTMAEGFGAFEKLDGQKLSATGKGVAALAGGLTVFGATSALANLGNIAGSMVEGMGKLFGAKSPVEKLQEFSKLNIDTEKVKANAEAMHVFNKALSTMVPIQVDILGSLASLVGIKPFAPLQNFSKLDINNEKVKTNADSLTAYNKALSTMVPIQLDILGTLASLVGIKPFTKFQEFSKLDVDSQKVTANSDALLVFNKALSTMVPVQLDILGALASLVGIKPFTKFEEFSQLPIDAQKVTANADAFLVFNKALSTMVPVQLDILGALASLVGMNPFAKFEEFSKLDVDAQKVTANADAFLVFNKALSEMAPVPLDILGALASLVGIKPFTKFEEFNQLPIDAQKVTANADAFLVFNKAIGEMKPIPTNMLSGLSSLVGMKPFAQFEEFSKLKINSDQVKKNAEAFEAYNAAMAKAKPAPAASFSDIATSAAGAISSFAKPLLGIFKDKKEETAPSKQQSTKESVKEFTFSEMELAKKDKKLYEEYLARRKEIYQEKLKKLGANVSIDDKNDVRRDAELQAKQEFAERAEKIGAAKITRREVPIARAEKAGTPGDIKNQVPIARAEKTETIKEFTFSEMELAKKDKKLYEEYLARRKEVYQEKLKALGKDVSIDDKNDARRDAELQAKQEFAERAEKIGAAKITRREKVTSPASAIPDSAAKKITPIQNQQSAKNAEIIDTVKKTLDTSLPRTLAQPGEETQQNIFGNLLQSSDELTGSFIKLTRQLDESINNLNNMSNTFIRYDMKLKKDLTRNIPEEVSDSFEDALEAGVKDAGNLRKQLRGEVAPTSGAVPPSETPSRPTPTPAPITPPAALPPSPPSRPPEVKQEAQKNLADLKSVLMSKGETDEKYLNAVLGNVMKETGGKVVEENLNYGKTSNDRIRSIFGQRAAGMSDAQLNQIKQDPKQMGEFMYGSNTSIGKRMGNLEPGDGWKYRGRGYVQLTGKTNYLNASTAIFGDDRLVNDPDLVNDSKIAAEVTAWYMQKTKSKMQQKLGISGPMSQEQANQLATSQVAGRVVNRDGSYLGSTLSKVDQYSTQVAGIKPNTTSGSPNYQGEKPREAPITIASAKNTETSKNRNATGPNFKTSARDGAIIDGPKTGYPVDLTAHGREVIAPLEAGSILEMLSSTPVNQQVSETQNFTNVNNQSDSGIQSLLTMNEQFNQLMIQRLDLIAEKLSQSNDTQGRILQYTKV